MVTEKRKADLLMGRPPKQQKLHTIINISGEEYVSTLEYGGLNTSHLSAARASFPRNFKKTIHRWMWVNDMIKKETRLNPEAMQLKFDRLYQELAIPLWEERRKAGDTLAQHHVKSLFIALIKVTIDKCIRNEGQNLLGKAYDLVNGKRVWKPFTSL